MRLFARPSFGLFAAVTLLLAGCASDPKPPAFTDDDKAFVDDGTDYYSAEAQSGDPVSIFSEQWETDEEGNRIYTMNTHDVLGNDRYYVGDIRYLPSQRDADRQPLYYDRWGNPIYDLNHRYRGSTSPYGYGYPVPRSRTVRVVPRRGGSATPPSTPAAPPAAPPSVSRPATPRVRDYRHMEAPRQRVRNPSDPRRRAD